MSMRRIVSTGVCVTSIVQRQRRPAISTSSEVLSMLRRCFCRRTSVSRFIATQCAMRLVAQVAAVAGRLADSLDDAEHAQRDDDQRGDHFDEREAARVQPRAAGSASRIGNHAPCSGRLRAAAWSARPSPSRARPCAARRAGRCRPARPRATALGAPSRSMRSSNGMMSPLDSTMICGGHFLLSSFLARSGSPGLSTISRVFQPEPEAQSFGQRARARTAGRRRSASHSLRRGVEAQEFVVGRADEDGHVDRLQLRFLAGLPQHGPEAPRLFFDFAVRGRARRSTSVAIETITPMMTMTTRISRSVKPLRSRARSQGSLRLPVAPVGVDAFAAFLAVGAERVEVVLAVLAGIDVEVVVAARDPCVRPPLPR